MIYLYINSCMHTTGSCGFFELHQQVENSLHKLRIVIDAI